jgi:hypothetical protein
MRIYELIDFTKNHAELKSINIQSCFDDNDPQFHGTVIELLETQYLFLDVPVVNSTYDIQHGVLNIFYDPDDI